MYITDFPTGIIPMVIVSVGSCPIVQLSKCAVALEVNWQMGNYWIVTVGSCCRGTYPVTLVRVIFGGFQNKMNQ